jgi:hypothetical protein
MLRVTTILHEDHYRFELHGILGAEWVPLFERHWHALVDGVPAARVTVVLTDVDFIDADGEGLLRRMADTGVDFVVSGCMNRYVVEKVQSSTCVAKGAR